MNILRKFYIIVNYGKKFNSLLSIFTPCYNIVRWNFSSINNLFCLMLINFGAMMSKSEIFPDKIQKIIIKNIVRRLHGGNTKKNHGGVFYISDLCGLIYIIYILRRRHEILFAGQI